MLFFYLQLIETEADQQLFIDLYENHKKQMHWVAKGVLRDGDLAEDAVHTAFIGIAKNMHSLHGRSKRDIVNYALKAAKNTALNMLDQEKRYWDFLPEQDCENEAIEDGVLESLCTKENFTMVVDAITRLKEPYNTVLYCYFVMEMGYKDIASTLNRKADAVRQQLSRGKRLLHDELKGVVEDV